MVVQNWQRLRGSLIQILVLVAAVAVFVTSVDVLVRLLVSIIMILTDEISFIIFFLPKVNSLINCF